MYSDLNTTNNNLSNSGIPIVKKITDLYSIKTSGFYYYDAGAMNAPLSSRGGMIIANYLSDSWISLIVVPYASSKIYTNTNLSNRFSSDSLVYNSIDDIPKSGSCFGTISKSIKIGTITIPAYSRFSFINTGTSTDGALFAIDSNGYSYTAYRTSGVWNKCFATATKDDLNTVLMYRGVITGDLNRGRNLVIAPGIYSIQSVSTITNGPSDFGGWGIFVQFPDNLFSQMILNSPNYIKFRKYSGQNPSWGAW